MTTFNGHFRRAVFLSGTSVVGPQLNRSIDRDHIDLETVHSYIFRKAGNCK